jgi:hypothetical protein
VDTDYLKLLTTVCPSEFARPAIAAANVWLDRTKISSFDPRFVGFNRNDFGSKFMPQYPRVRIDGMLPSKCMKIASAYAYLQDPDNGV